VSIPRFRNIIIRLVLIGALVAGWIAHSPTSNGHLAASPNESPILEDGVILDEAAVIQNLRTVHNTDGTVLDPGVEPFQADLLKIELARIEGLNALMALAEELDGDALEIAQAEIWSILGLRSNRVGAKSMPAKAGAPQRVGINGGGCTFYAIQDAVDAAAVTGDTIQVSAGTYYETVDITGKESRR